MFNKIKIEARRVASKDGGVAGIVERFTMAKDESATLKELEAGYLGETGTLCVQQAEDLQAACKQMRKKGLGLEPNLLSRLIPRFAPSRHLAAKWTASLASQDNDFRELTATADAARDRGSFGEAEYSYWRALELYPHHCGYLTQYGHALKEQEKFVDAFIEYTTAAMYMSDRKEIIRHIEAVAACCTPPLPFVQHAIVRGANADEQGLGQCADKRDIKYIYWMMINRHPTNTEIASIIATATSRRDLIVKLLRKV